MKNLSIKNVPEMLHERLKRRAADNHRSLNGEVLAILEATIKGKVGKHPEQERGHLTDFLLNSPMRGASIELDRNFDGGREQEL